VVTLGSVIADEQHPASSRYYPDEQQRGGDTKRSNGQVLTAAGRGTSSNQRSRLLTTSGRTVCRKTSKGLKSGMLIRQPLPEPSLPKPPGRSH